VIQNIEREVNEMRKKITALLLGVVLAASAVTPALATTINFDITVPNDPFSRRTRKSDNEQRFYVTGTFFNSNNAYLDCVSYQTNDGYIQSYSARIRSSSNRSSAAYRSYARYGVDYHIRGNSPTVGFRVRGRYTP
jgi:hypothetical protein